MTSERLSTSDDQEPVESPNAQPDNGSFTIEIITNATAEEGDLPDLDATSRSLEKDAMGMYIDDLYRNGKEVLTAEEEVILSKRIEAGLASAALLDGRMVSDMMVTQEELKWLAQDGADAKREMLEGNVRLVVSTARKYGRRVTASMQVSDIVSNGNVGLVRAVEKFDYYKGYKFSTYATWWIRQAITRGIADGARTIRIPVHTVEDLNAMQRAEREYLAKHDRDPTVEALIEETGFSRKKILQLKQDARREPDSLNRPLGEDGTEFGDMIEGEDGRDFFDTLLEVQLARQVVLTALDMLDSRSAEVIKRRWGFNGEPETLDAIGKHFGVTRERIRQLESHAFSSLRKIVPVLLGEETGKEQAPAGPLARKDASHHDTKKTESGLTRREYKSELLRRLATAGNEFPKEYAQYIRAYAHAKSQLDAALTLGTSLGTFRRRFDDAVSRLDAHEGR